MSRSTSVIAGSLEVPGARLHYEVRGEGPVVVLVGAPMDATAFAPLADLLADDHVVVTTDPRGVNRSPVDDPEQDSTPWLRADDLSRLLAHLGTEPAVVVGSSGGAVSALALAQYHPEQVHTIVAHEPPVSELLDDRGQILVSTDDLIATYLAGDVLDAWAKFMAQACITMPDGVLEQMFGGERPAQVVADEHHWFAHEMRETILFRPDIAVLRDVPTRIIVGVGEQSTGQICDRTSAALAAELGIERTSFPGGHTGFVEVPDLFAARLRAVLDGSAA